MAWYKNDLITLQKENVVDYFKHKKPSEDLIMGYRDGTLDAIRLMQEINQNQSFQTVDQMRDALTSLHKNRLELISEIDKVEGANRKKNLKNSRRPE